MTPRIILAVDAALDGGLAAARRSGRQLSYDVGEQVLVVEASAAQLAAIHAIVEATGDVVSAQAPRPKPTPSAAPMAAAPFRWRDDGRPDWGSMWQDFCELALFGGPPHRGEAQALRAPSGSAAGASPSESIAEIQRGIYETTGLRSEPAEPGWLAVACDSPKMAAWLCATIILENVEARCAGSTLFVPAAPDFEIADQVKSVITVLAKTSHYWQAHLASPAMSEA